MLASETSWSPKQLETYSCSPEDSDKVKEQSYSLRRYNEIFIYHLCLTRDALKKVSDEGDSLDGDTGIKLILQAVGPERQKEFYAAKLETEANFLACIYTVRNMYDVFSQLVNTLVLQNKLSLRSCNIHKVEEELSPSDLKVSITDLLKSDEFMYLNAFCNTIKHRNLLKIPSRIEIPIKKFGLHIKPFKYEEQSYKEYWLDEALEKVVAVKNRITACGNALNNHLTLAAP